jgi:hypothetical protein
LWGFGFIRRRFLTVSSNDAAGPPDLDDLARAIGYLTIAWAFLESALDTWIDAIHEKWDGRNLNLELPRTAFHRKIAYIREWHTSYPHGPDIFPDIPRILDNLTRLSDDRHWISHSVLVARPDFLCEAGYVRIARRNKRTRKQEMAETTVPSIQTLTASVLEHGSLLGASTAIFEGNNEARDDFCALAVRFSRGLKLS